VSCRPLPVRQTAGRSVTGRGTRDAAAGDAGKRANRSGGADVVVGRIAQKATHECTSKRAFRLGLAFTARKKCGDGNNCADLEDLHVALPPKAKNAAEVLAEVPMVSKEKKDRSPGPEKKGPTLGGPGESEGNR
jgi:hypothetical protein